MHANAYSSTLQQPSGSARGDNYEQEADRVDAHKGRPLDSSTKAFFESRFGHNFADVRIHTGPSAAAKAGALDAEAFTSGEDVVFNSGRYRPQSVEGRFLLAHELAHVAHQRGAARRSASTAIENPALEREANHAAVRVTLGGSARVAASASATASQCFKISSGGFGKALDNVTTFWAVPDATMKLLLKSPTFMAMAATLDKVYISIDEAMGYGFPAFVSQKGYKQLDPSGKISGISPTVDGKRIIGFALNPAGANFKAAWSPDNSNCGDVIEVKDTAKDVFLHDLIHESSHATRFVTGVNPAAATMADEINVSIKDEIAARTTEEKGLKEIPDPSVRAGAANVGSKIERDVQRDLAPAFGLTYLENIYFGRKLREQQKTEGISDIEAEEISRSVRKNPDSGIFWQRAFPKGPTSDFAYLCYKRERVVQDWKNFFARNNPSDNDFAKNKEATLQAHVHEWMNSEVSYLP